VQKVSGLTIEEYEYLSEKALQNGLEVLAWADTLENQ
jgi:hypothetical protein